MKELRLAGRVVRGALKSLGNRLIRKSFDFDIHFSNYDDFKQSLDDAQRTLEKVQDRMRNTRPLLQAASQVYYESTMQRFRSHTSPQGQAWKWLKPRTIADKKRMGATEPYHQLIRTRQLMNSIRVRWDGSQSVKVSTHVPYAKAHQFGAPTRGIPQRQFLGRTAAADARIKGIMRQHFAGLS